jgi:hypothetical protein
MVMPDGTSTTELVTECKRCRAGSPGTAARSDEVLDAIRQLDGPDVKRIRQWMAQERRGSTALERAWSLYKRLPASGRDAVRRELNG